MDVSIKTRFEFEDYVLLPSERLLIKNGEVVLLKPKVFETLLTLVLHSGELLSKDDLMKIIWGGRFVEEGNLSQNIFTLRKIFGESPRNHRFIVTVPGHGYRFVAKVFVYSDETDQSYKPDTPSSLGRQIRSLAVLPLKYLSSQVEENFYGLAVADTLITELSGNRNISIRSTSAILKYVHSDRDPITVGRDLNVDAVLSGTLIKSAGKIFLNIQLMNVFNRIIIWANRFEEAESNFLESHSKIAQQIAKALAIEFQSTESALKLNKPKNQEVYQIYLKARFYWEKRTEEGVHEGLKYANEVINAEPDFPLGYIGLADSYLLLGEYLYVAPDESFPKAKSVAEKALQIQPDLGEGFASLAEYYFFYKRDWKKAEEYYCRAIELTPNYASAKHGYTWFLLAMNRPNEALKQIEEAQSLDPSSMILNTIRGLPFYYKKDFERAITQFRRVLEIDPNVLHARYYLGSALVQSGDVDAAIEEFYKSVAAQPNQQAIGLLGYCLAVAGERNLAREQLTKLDKLAKERYVTPYVKAFIYNGLGDTERTYHQLEKACQENSAWVVWLAVDPFFDNLRKESRFKKLITRLNFPL